MVTVYAQINAYVMLDIAVTTVLRVSITVLQLFRQVLNADYSTPV